MHDKDTATIYLVRKKITRQAVLDTLASSRMGLPSQSGARVMTSMAEIARVFSPRNLALLQVLRDAGHVSLEDAAKKTGFPTAEALMRRIMLGGNREDGEESDGGLHLFVEFAPMPDRTPGIRVGFSKLLIDLDLEPRASGSDPEQYLE